MSIRSVLDRAGLRLCLSQTNSETVEDLFSFIFNNYFSSSFASRQMSEVQLNEQTATQLLRYLLLCEDVLSNETDIPLIINTIFETQPSAKSCQTLRKKKYYQDHAVVMVTKISKTLLGLNNWQLSDEKKKIVSTIMDIILKDKTLVRDCLERLCCKKESQISEGNGDASFLPLNWFSDKLLKRYLMPYERNNSDKTNINSFQSALTQKICANFINTNMRGSIEVICKWVLSIESFDQTRLCLRNSFHRLLLIILNQCNKKQQGAEEMKNFIKSCFKSTQENKPPSSQAECSQTDQSDQSSSSTTPTNQNVEKQKTMQCVIMFDNVFLA